MTRAGWMAGCVLAAALGAGTASAADYTSFFDGGDYNKLSPDQREVYIMGLSDMMERMSDTVDNATERAFLDRAHRCTANMRGGELRDYIDAYMKSGDFAKYAMASNYRAALNVKCPR